MARRLRAPFATLAISLVSLTPVPAAVMAAPEGSAASALDLKEEIPLWPGSAPGSEKVAINEAITERSTDPQKHDRIFTHIVTPSLRLYLPAASNGAAVIVAPGGGYQRIVIDKENLDICRWLNSQGVAAFVLKYRLPGEGHERGRDVPLQDAQRAIRIVRQRASKWGLDPKRVGTIGFSAGGHLTATLAMYHSRPVYKALDEADALSARPDFVILGYAPAGRTSPTAVAVEALDPREQLMREYVIDTAVTKDAPPAFLFHADDDPTVASSQSARVYQAYKAAGVPAELHVFRTGGHGFGIRDAVGPVSLWPQLCAAWLQGIGVTP